jgi:large subunit ribosomal protein L15
MKLHDLKPDKGSKKKKTRVGRGISAGKGKTAGRGTKGAGARGRHARKGAYFEGGQLPLVRRLPFKRGFTNLFRIEYQEVKIEQLAALPAGTVVTPELLAQHRLIRDALNPVVVLGNGELKHALTVNAHRFTKSAAAKITEAGGTINMLKLAVTGARFTIKRLPREKLAKLMAAAAAAE